MVATAEPASAIEDQDEPASAPPRVLVCGRVATFKSLTARDKFRFDALADRARRVARERFPQWSVQDSDDEIDATLHVQLFGQIVPLIQCAWAGPDAPPDSESLANESYEVLMLAFQQAIIANSWYVTSTTPPEPDPNTDPATG